MRGVKMTDLNIDSLVSGNVRICGIVYTPQQARQFFHKNKQVENALATAHHYHLMARDGSLTVSSAFIMSLNKLMKSA